MRTAGARRWVLWAPCLAYMLLIFAMSSQTAIGPPAGSDKLAHAAAYALLTLLYARALGGSLRAAGGRDATGAWLLSSLYGVSDELHQWFVPGRYSSGGDVTADMVGSLLAAVAVWRLGRGDAAPRRNVEEGVE